jgi:hypothetical protein
MKSHALTEKWSRSEQSLSETLRAATLHTIQHRNMSDEQVAELLGILPSGSMNLRNQETWPVSFALRVADALEVELIFEVQEVQD